MTSIPRPLKFLRAHYQEIKEKFENFEEKTTEKEKEINIIDNKEDHKVSVIQHYNIIMTYKNGELEGEDTKETFREKRTITKEKVSTEIVK